MKSEQNINELVKNYRPPSAKSKEEAWQQLNARMETEQPKQYKFGWLRLAAAFMAVAFISSVLADSFLFTEKYVTNFAEQQTIVLNDESEVLLNPNSELKVNYSFISGKRRLKLDGEALFDVKPGKTFSVEFNEGKVEVLGTRFIVTSYENIDSEVACITGSVKVKSGGDEAVLNRGEGIYIDDQSGLTSIKVEEKKILDEFKAIYSFQNETLNDIFRILEARSGYKVQASEDVLQRKFSGDLNLSEPEAVCDILSFAMNLNCSINHQSKIIKIETTK